ncbi:hypothetical protein [Streptomyces diastaticus]|uniref:hypothetical protein n=1 Tax=Streptomyces diastaticus TaxID=1956 RepID=UPI0035E1C234
MTSTDPIREAKNRWARRRRRLAGYGQWQPFVPAGPARAHVAAIQATGMGIATISKHTGVSIASLDHLMYGSGPYPPAVSVRPETAAALLAYRPRLDDYPDLGKVDATGTMRRLRALAVAGWPASQLRHRAGVAVTTLEIVRRGDRKTVTARLARTVRAMTEELATTSPADHGVRPCMAARTSRQAVAAGWKPLMAWDDDTIDDPATRPFTGDDELSREELAAYRRIEIDHLNSCGVPVHEIADRVGLAVGSVEGILRQLRNGQTHSRDMNKEAAA